MDRSNRIFGMILLVITVCMIGQCILRMGNTEEVPTIAGHTIDPEIYRGLLEEGFFPLRPEMSDMELAKRLNLDLPQLAEVKAAVEKKDDKGIESALAGYLNTRMPPRNIVPTGKIPYNAAVADQWLKDEILMAGKPFKLGERLNWWYSIRPRKPGEVASDADLGFSLGAWAHPLINAYADTGDPKYAQTLLTFCRSFYHNARPPGKITNWGGKWFRGAWHTLWASGNIHPAYLPEIYRTIGRYSGVTDADRVMFLKMFWEHTDYCYQLTNTHNPHNFEVHVLNGLLYMALTLPDFNESPKWLGRVTERFTQNMQDCVLEDGGVYERTGYQYAYEGPYKDVYRRLRDAGVSPPEVFKQGLEKMNEFSIFILAPTLEFPMFGHGGLGPMTSVMELGAELFPDREDFAYISSGGKRGHAPPRVAKVFPYTGWLTMRSDWSREALYMAVNYNGTPSGTDGHDDLLSFGLWAYGFPWMTNSGTTAAYGDPEERNNEHTISSNTVMVDQTTQGRYDNCGRLESWSSLPESGSGFTYLSGVSDAYIYRGAGVTHRRGILFVRPHYWLIYDRLTGDGAKTGHEYRWQGHFQPTELTVTPDTKIISTKPQDGKRLWLVPAQPESFALEQKNSPITTREGRKLAPYISLVKSDVNDAAFTLLLCPANEDEKAPFLERLVVREQGRDIPDTEAVGYRVRRGESVDILTMAESSRLRKYGTTSTGLITDGEMAYIRLNKDNVVEAGIFRGTSIDYGSKRLLLLSPDIASCYIRYTGGMIEVSAQGNGEVSLLAGSSAKVILNGRVVAPVRNEGMLKFKAGSQEGLKLTKPVFSTTPEDLGRAIGIPRPLAYRDAVVIKWKTSSPSDATIEYRKEEDKRWIRTVNPEFSTDHRFVIRRLEDGKTYNLRIVCYGEDGSPGRLDAPYTHIDPQKNQGR